MIDFLNHESTFYPTNRVISLLISIIKAYMGSHEKEGQSGYNNRYK